MTPAAVAAVAFGALAVSAAGTGASAGSSEAVPPVAAATASPQPARPAESGARDSAATIGPLAIGAEVRDPSGALVGHIVVLTTDKQGRSVAKVREDEDVFLIPAQDLYVRRGATFSSLSLDQLRHGGSAIAAGPDR